MKTNNIMLILLLSAACLSAQADDRSDEEMISIANAALRGENSPARVKSQAGGESVRLVASERTYNVYSTSSNEYVMVSRDTRFAPVLAKAAGDFTGDNHSAAFKWWLSATTKAMEAAIEEGDYSMTSRATNYNLSPVEPMVTTVWGQQTQPYNIYTPIINQTRSAVGCAALTIAEILNYHKYPESADFTGSYSIDGGKTFRTQSVSSTYKWNFKDMYGSYSLDGTSTNMGNASYSPSQGRAIGNLLMDCGYSVDMIYGEESSTESNKVPLAFVDKFGFASEGTHIRWADFYTDEEWANMIHNEFTSGHPVCIFGTDPAGYGHIFIGHGCDENGLIAIEWGWRGIDNGYFAIDQLKPSNYSFTKNVGIVTAHPHKLPTDVFHSTWITERPYSITYNSTANSITIRLVDGIYNFDKDKFTGQIALVMEKTDNGQIGYVSLTNDKDYEFESFNGIAATTTTLTDCVFDANSVYYVYLASKDARDAGWQPLRTIGGAFYYTLRTDSYGNPSFDDDFSFTNGMEDIIAPSSDTNAPTEYFNLNGQAVPSSNKGLTIVRQGMTTRKVLFE